jgi:hypothetical protein
MTNNNDYHDGDVEQYIKWLVTATTIFMLWALFMTLVRLWARWSRKLGTSTQDGIFAAAFVSGPACLPVKRG